MMRARVIALVALLAGSSTVGCGGASATGPTTPAEPPRRECTAALRFEEPPEPDAAAERSDEEPPRTAMSLVLICEDEPTRRLAIGSEVGACFAAEPSEGALLGARCWWAGQGAVIEVRRRDDVLEIRRADIDEHTGIGEVEQTSELPVPEGADVRAL